MLVDNGDDDAECGGSNGTASCGFHLGFHAFQPHAAAVSDIGALVSLVSKKQLSNVLLHDHDAHNADAVHNALQAPVVATAWCTLCRHCPLSGAVQWIDLLSSSRGPDGGGDGGDGGGCGTGLVAGLAIHGDMKPWCPATAVQ